MDLVDLKGLALAYLGTYFIMMWHIWSKNVYGVVGLAYPQDFRFSFNI